MTGDVSGKPTNVERGDGDEEEKEEEKDEKHIISFQVLRGFHLSETECSS